MLNKAYINLALLKKNAQTIKSRLPRSTKFCAVVKADAYGHGAPKVASALYGMVDCFAVALAEEAIQLRLSGIDKDILVLSPVYPYDAKNLVRYGLIATVSSIEELIALAKEGEKQKIKAKAHVKFNTGMNRQGVDTIEKLQQIFQFSKTHKWVEVCGMYSHFACPENKKARKKAEKKFLLANNVVKIYNNRATCHISASGGFLKGAYYDMVRIGILLYGYKPFKDETLSVKPIMRVVAPVLSRRWLKRGECALYGKCKAKKGQVIELIRYGYADGLNRVAVKGQFNNRCMDITAIIGSKQRKSVVNVMDNAEKIAKKYGTISYEILTGASRRAEKIYIYGEDE